MVSFLASRLLGLVREQVIAGRLGTSPEYDAYLAAFRVPDFLYLVVMGGALGSALIPVLAEHRSRGDLRSAEELANTVLTVATLAIIAAASAAWVMADYLMVHVVAPGLPAHQQQLAGQLTRVLLLSPILLGVAGIVMAYLNAQHRFLGPALAPLAYNLSIIMAAVVAVPLLGVVGLAIGVVIGAFFNLAVQVPDLASVGYRFRPSLRVGSSAFRKVAALLVPRMFGQVAYQTNFIVITALASTLAAGSISALNYAYLLMMLPHGIFAMSIAVSSFPVMADLVARGKGGEMERTVVGALSSALFLGLPAAVGLCLLRMPIVRLLFEAGAFTSGSTEMVGQALVFMAFGVLPYGAVEVLTRAFYAFGDTRRPVAAGLATVLTNLLLAAVLSRLMAHSGLALALVIATVLESLILAAMLRRHLSWSWLRPAGREFSKSLLSSVPLVLFLWMAITFGGELVSGRRTLTGILGLTGVVFVGALLYLVMGIVLKSETARQVTKLAAFIKLTSSRGSKEAEV